MKQGKKGGERTDDDSADEGVVQYPPSRDIRNASSSVAIADATENVE
jgi:hypothetical protein